MFRSRFLTLVVACLSVALVALGGPSLAKAAAGASPAAASGWTSADKLICTYLFYWYDSVSGGHMVDSDGTDALTTHPMDMEDFSYNSVTWWQTQFEDMAAAGIDVALPVYWGSDSEEGWCQESLDVMAKALGNLASKGKPAPKVGMFYDTSALMQQNGGTNPDLRTAGGQAMFYGMIRDFFARVPQSSWALIDGKAVVSLYTAAFTAGHSQKTFDYARQQFKKDFGRDLFIIKEISWTSAEADDVYAWGAALAGPNFHGVAAIGPGYDDSSVPGRTTPKRDRAGGAFYEDAWKKVLARPVTRVVIETWNEFHEGTDIAASGEWGRKYIDLTAKYAKMFKDGVSLAPPPGKYDPTQAVSVALGATNKDEGVTLLETADGLNAAVPSGSAAGREGRKAMPGVGGMYLYFGVDDGWLSYANAEVEVTLEYLDRGKGSLMVQYDSNNAKAVLGGAYTDSKAIGLKGTGDWKTVKVALKGAKFSGRQNAGADFRIALPNSEVVLGKVSVRVVAPAPAPAPAPAK